MGQARASGYKGKERDGGGQSEDSSGLRGAEGGRSLNDDDGADALSLEQTTRCQNWWAKGLCLFCIQYLLTHTYSILSLYTAHSTHSLLYTLHYSLHAHIYSVLHYASIFLFTLYTFTFCFFFFFCSLWTLYITHILCTTLLSVRTLYITHTLYTSTTHTLHYTLYTFTLCSQLSTHSILHYYAFTHSILFLPPTHTLYTLHSTLYTLHSTLYTLHSTYFMQHTLYTLSLHALSTRSNRLVPNSALAMHTLFCERHNVCCMKCGRAIRVTDKEKHDNEFHSQVQHIYVYIHIYIYWEIVSHTLWQYANYRFPVSSVGCLWRLASWRGTCRTTAHKGRSSAIIVPFGWRQQTSRRTRLYTLIRDRNWLINSLYIAHICL